MLASPSAVDPASVVPVRFWYEISYQVEHHLAAGRAEGRAGAPNPTAAGSRRRLGAGATQQVPLVAPRPPVGVSHHGRPPRKPSRGRTRMTCAEPGGRASVAGRGRLGTTFSSFEAARRSDGKVDHDGAAFHIPDVAEFWIETHHPPSLDADRGQDAPGPAPGGDGLFGRFQVRPSCRRPPRSSSERAQVAVRRRHAVDLEAHAGRRLSRQAVFEPAHVGALLLRVDEALVPDPCGALSAHLDTSFHRIAGSARVARQPGCEPAGIREEDGAVARRGVLLPRRSSPPGVDGREPGGIVGTAGRLVNQPAGGGRRERLAHGSATS